MVSSGVGGCMFFVSLMTKFKHKIPEPRRSHLGVDLDEPLGRSANFRSPFVIQ
jgi:hypothetical protein